jgi:hypothetical protein
MVLRWFDHADAFPIPPKRFKFDDAANFGEQGVVFSTTNVLAGMDPGTALTYDYRSGADVLTAEPFYTQPLALAVAAVFRTTYAFFVSHFNPSRFPAVNRQNLSIEFR